MSLLFSRYLRKYFRGRSRKSTMDRLRKKMLECILFHTILRNFCLIFIKNLNNIRGRFGHLKTKNNATYDLIICVIRLRSSGAQIPVITFVSNYS